jgi:hypothetical protein
MSNLKPYVLEYWIDSDHSSGELLKENIEAALSKYLERFDLNITTNENYIVVHVSSSDKKIIDSCHDKLSFNREWSFRAKDDLGEYLRKEAYSILADIELQLRYFINRAMIEVLGFEWWNFISADIQRKVDGIESKTKEHKVKVQHQIEFTLFDDLIKIVTLDFQDWSSDQAITVRDLRDLLSTCTSIEEIYQKIEGRSKVVSFWDNVFSGYFDDKVSWTQIKTKLEAKIIPIRNQVMHHRLFRIFELD